jgi:YVTN family beta-propeller protein
MALMLATLVGPLSSFGQTKLYVVNGGADTISVIDTTTGAVIATIKGPGHLAAIAYNPQDGLLYLPTQEANGRVYMIDPATNSFVGNPIPVGKLSSYITISPELERLYVSNQFGGVSVIDTATRTVITEISSVVAPIGSAVSPKQRKLYVVNNQTSELSVIDATSNAVLDTLSIGCFNLLDVKIDALAHKALVTKSSCPELAVLDTKTDTLMATVRFPGSPPRRPQYIAIDAAAHRAYVSLVWGHEEDEMHGAIAIVDTVDNSIVGGIRVGSYPTRLVLHPSEKRLYITDRDDQSVYVVDTATDTVVGEIAVGSDPVDIAVVPATRPKLR